MFDPRTWGTGKWRARSHTTYLLRPRRCSRYDSGRVFISSYCENYCLIVHRIIVPPSHCSRIDKCQFSSAQSAISAASAVPPNTASATVAKLLHPSQLPRPPRIAPHALPSLSNTRSPWPYPPRRCPNTTGWACARANPFAKYAQPCSFVLPGALSRCALGGSRMRRLSIPASKESVYDRACLGCWKAEAPWRDVGGEPNILMVRPPF